MSVKSKTTPNDMPKAMQDLQSRYRQFVLESRKDHTFAIIPTDFVKCLEWDNNVKERFAGGRLNDIAVQGRSDSMAVISNRRLDRWQFRGAVFTAIHFKDCDMRNINFAYATFYGCIFENCNLCESGWTQAHLAYVKFINCDLTDSHIANAGRGQCVSGVHVIGSVGMHDRTIYSWKHGGEVWIQIGCTVYHLQGALEAIDAEYINRKKEGSLYKMAVRTAYKLAAADKLRVCER